MSKVKKTPKVRFNLKYNKARNLDEVLIMAVFRYHGKPNQNGKTERRLQYSTRKSINPKYWSSGAIDENAAFVPSGDNPEDRRESRDRHKARLRAIKSHLDKISHLIVDYYDSQEGNDILLDVFRDYLDCKLGIKKEELGDGSVLDYVEKYIERKKRSKSKSTIEKYSTTLKHLKGYQAHTQMVIDFDTFNWEFKESFEQYLYDHTEVNSSNTVGKLIKIIKLIIKEAYRDGLHKNEIFRESDWGIKEVKYKKVALTPNEVELLKNLDLSSNKELEQSRDLFLLGVYTGLRVSDYTNIKPENVTNIEGERFLRVFTKKTKTEVYIPFTEDLDDLLRKYNYRSPKSISTQRLNTNIKKIGCLAKIDTIVLQQYNDQGESKTKSVPKYALLSSHVGRRSWASINYAKGYPIALLTLVTGHSSPAQFLDYVNVKKEELAISLIKEMRRKSSSEDGTRLKVV